MGQSWYRFRSKYWMGSIRIHVVKKSIFDTDRGHEDIVRDAALIKIWIPVKK